MFQNPFFPKKSHDLLSLFEQDSNVHSQISPHIWLISADKIFSSEIEGYKDFAKFHSMEFCIRRSSVFFKEKSSDSSVFSEDVKIYMQPGRHSALIQSRISSGTTIPKISIKKINISSTALEPLEEKDFSNCIIQSFERNGDMTAFSFRYTSYSDSYTDFKNDGSKKGTSATSINLVTWEIKEK